MIKLKNKQYVIIPTPKKLHDSSDLYHRKISISELICHYSMPKT